MRRHNKGVILITVMWVVLILSLLVWGLSRRSALEVSVLETYQGKIRSYAAARAGLNTILDLMQKSPSTKDTLYSSGINIEQGKKPTDIFSHIQVGNDTYSIVQWTSKAFTNDGSSLDFLGLQDEQGKININAITITNTQYLSALFVMKGLSAQNADTLASAIVRFHGSGGNSQGPKFSLKDDDDEDMLKPKNGPYQDLLELLEVKGMTQELFNKVKDDLTVYGDVSSLQVNVYTANNDVIQALADGLARTTPGTDEPTLIRQAQAARDAANAPPIPGNDTGGANISNWPAPAGASTEFRAHVIGVDERTGTRSVIEVVLSRPQGGGAPLIKEWQRD